MRSGRMRQRPSRSRASVGAARIPRTTSPESGTLGRQPVDWPAMEARDRTANLAFLAAAGVVWLLVALLVTTRDPRVDPAAGPIGALLIGLALALTAVPLFWLAVFGRHRRIAYRGDWTRAIRRGGWVGIIAVAFVILRLQQVFQLSIALFILALVVLAEVTLSVER